MSIVYIVLVTIFLTLFNQWLIAESKKDHSLTGYIILLINFFILFGVFAIGKIPIENTKYDKVDIPVLENDSGYYADINDNTTITQNDYKFCKDNKLDELCIMKQHRKMLIGMTKKKYHIVKTNDVHFIKIGHIPWD